MPTFKLPRSHGPLKASKKNLLPFQLGVGKVSNETTHRTMEILQEESWQQAAPSLACRALISQQELPQGDAWNAQSKQDGGAIVDGV